MAAFLFARALNETEEFKLASNVDGAGNFDDLVFRYRLKETCVCKTCFIQLKHRKTGHKFKRSCLKNNDEKLNLLHFFKSYCKIKKNAATERNLSQYGQFVDSEFVIYTNGKMGGKSTYKGDESDPLSILSSGKDKGKYITFDEKSENDRNFFEYFEKFSQNKGTLIELNSVLNSRDNTDEEIQKVVNELSNVPQNTTPSGEMKCKEDTEIQVATECDYTLYKEFLKTVKIFHEQLNEESLRGLIEEELQEACKASQRDDTFNYLTFQEDIVRWFVKDGEVEWLNKNSKLWKAVQKNSY